MQATSQTQSFLKSMLLFTAGPARLPLPWVREKAVRWAQRGLLARLAEAAHPTYRTAMLDDWLALVGKTSDVFWRNLKGNLRGRDEVAKRSVADTYALYRAASRQIEVTGSMEIHDRAAAQRAFDEALPRGGEIAVHVLERLARHHAREPARQRALKEAGISERAPSLSEQILGDLELD